MGCMTVKWKQDTGTNYGLIYGNGMELEYFEVIWPNTIQANLKIETWEFVMLVNQMASIINT